MTDAVNSPGVDIKADTRVTIPGITVSGVTLERTLPTPERWDHHLVLTLPEPCEVVSSAPLNGGFGRYRAVVNRSVPQDWQGDKGDIDGVGNDPETAMKRYVTRLGLPAETTVGLITAVSMADLRYAVAERSGWRVHTLLTAGVGNAAAAGGQFSLDGLSAGTVNVIVLLEGHLSPSALIGAVQSATEAKTAALRDLGVTTQFGEPATGTTTDIVTVVNLSTKPTSPYAGLATPPGFLVAETVYTALSAALS